MSNMTILAKELLHIGAEPVIRFNNKNLVHITRYQTLSPETSEFSEDCIYVVTDRDSSSGGRLLNSPGNFLFFGPPPHNINRSIGHDTNVMFINRKTPLADLHASLERCCKAFNTFSACSEKMLQAVLQKESITDYINVCSEMFGNPVLLLKNTSVIVAADIKTGKRDPLEESDILNTLGNMECGWIPGAQDDISYPVISRTPSGTCLMITSFCPDGHSAYSICIASSDGDFEESDYPLAERAAEMLIRIMNSSAAPESTLTFAQFFDRAVSATSRNNSLTLSRAEALNFHPDGRMYMYMIYPEENLHSDLVRISGRIESAVKGIVFPYHFTIILLSNAPADICISEIKAIIRKEKNAWRFVRSLPLESAIDLRRAYSECISIRRVGRHYARGEAFISYEQLTGQLLLLRYQELSDDITDYMLPSAKAVIEYDTLHGTDYRTTLRTYIRTFRNIQITADELHVHRNTIHFRLQKISEIFNIDLEDYKLLNGIGFSFDICESTRVFRELR